MKHIFLTLLVSTLATVGFAQSAVINDANAQPRTLSGSFHTIEVSSAVDLFLSQGTEEGLAVSASDVKWRGNIKTEVKDGVLHIWYENVGRISFGRNRKLRAYVSFKTLDKLVASGASDVLVDGTIKSDHLELHFSGASDFKGAVEANTLRVDIKGASDMTIKGTAGAINIDASGASDFKGYDLVSQTCDLTASGASDIKITCNKELNATASGASDVHIKGNGVIRNMRNSGASSVKKV
ncbi:MAG TPA: head GIN domain-containing protein [Chitinophagaceae bacterium]|jgi:hypothetical protein